MAHLSFLHFAHASMLLDCQLDIVYAFLDCSHLLLIATTVIAQSRAPAPTLRVTVFREGEEGKGRSNTHND